MNKELKISFLSSTLKKKPNTVTKRAGLIFPVRRVYKILKSGHFAPRIAIGAAIYLAAILEYLSIEILELSGSAAIQNRRKRILPRHILLAIRNDDEFNLMLKDVVISQGGVLPRIEPELLFKKMSTSRINSSISSSQEY